jgi:hypothetical protein
MSSLSLLGAIEALRSRGQLETRYFGLKYLLERFQPSPSNSARALLLKLFESIPGLNYRVVPIFWGKTFSRDPNDKNFPSQPYRPKQFQDALNQIADISYFALLNQYGAKSIGINSFIEIDNPWPLGNDYYVAIFTEEDIKNFITRNIAALPQSAKNIQQIYLVIIPHGSLRDVGALGAHSAFPFQGSNILWAWMYGSPSLSSAIHTASHEIAEVVGANGGAPKELCDDCQKTYSEGWKTLNDLTVESYFDAYSGKCFAPGGVRPAIP